MQPHKLFTEKKDIEKWLKRYNILNYKLIEDTAYGWVVDVYSNVFLFGYDLKELKVKFNTVHGDFHCENNYLETLYGCPSAVLGDFWCYHNELKSLEYGPSIVNETYICDNNYLVNLLGAPKIVGEIDLSNNCIENLAGLSDIAIKTSAIFANNKIEKIRLEDIPQTNITLDLRGNELLGDMQAINTSEELRAVLEKNNLNHLLNSTLTTKIYKI